RLRQRVHGYPCPPRSLFGLPPDDPTRKSTQLERSLPLPSAGGSSNRRRFLFRFLQEGHHLSKRFADCFNRVLRFVFTHLLEIRPTGFVFRDPLFRECPVLDLVQDLLHRLPTVG